MNEQLQKALLEVLTTVLSAKDFILAELPDVIRQLLIWKFWVSILGIPAAAILLGILFFCIRYTYKNWDEIFRKDVEALIIPCLALYAVVAITISFNLIFDLDWLQIWLAPKIYLIEYASKLAK